MRKLYWKIFIWFWIATILTIIVTALLSSKVTQHSSNDLPDQAFIATIDTVGSMMIKNDQLDQFHSWAKLMHERFGIVLQVIPADDTRDDRDIPPQLQPFLHRVRIQPRPITAIIHPPFLASGTLHTKDGHRYRLIGKLPEHLTEKFNFSWPDIILRLSVAILISGFICYLLSLYLSRPIRVLQRAARRLGRGDFNTRVGKELYLRKDELSELAFEFDDMAARLQSLMQTRQQLLQDISHELRSPLARLSVALELARSKDLDTEHPELTRIELECERLNELIRKILSLASLNLDEEEMKFETVKLNHLIQSTIDDANYEAQRKHTKLELNATESITVRANQSLLSSAIENVIRNTLRYSPDEQPIEINLTVEGKMAKLRIRDHGPGIPEDKIHHIFEPFYRVDASRTANTGGFGLGLAIAKKAITLHKGKINAKNHPEGGLIITMTLPVIAK